MNVIVTGSLGFDYIMDFPGRFAERIMPDKIHKISLSFLVDKLSKNFGGCAGNIAYTLKLLGMEPLVLGSGGNDFSPYKDHFYAHKIRTDYISNVTHVATGSYFVVTDKDDNQIGSFYRGALTHNEHLSVTKVKDPVSLVVIAANTPVAMVRYVRECQKKNMPYLYDPAFQIESFSTTELYEAISRASIFVGNDYEVALVEKKLKLTHKQIIDLVPIVVTTLAGKGSLVETRNVRHEVKAAKPASVIDPTGAGDAYRAGFITGFLLRYDLATCGRMGSVAAAYTVEKYGTQTHMFSKKQFCERYYENFHQKLNL